MWSLCSMISFFWVKEYILYIYQSVDASFKDLVFPYIKMQYQKESWTLDYLRFSTHLI
jgi:hypothetical protein